MSLPVHFRSVVEAPNGKSITLEFCGEHHMGADHVEFIPSEPVHGIRRFFTTNGRLAFREDDACFYLYDEHCLLLRIDSRTWQASHLSASRCADFQLARKTLISKLSRRSAQSSEEPGMLEPEW